MGTSSKEHSCVQIRGLSQSRSMVSVSQRRAQVKLSLRLALIVAAALAGCRKSDSKQMKERLPDWKREHYQRGEGRALIHFVVYGEFTNDVAISGSKYRTDGLPRGFSLHKVTRNQHEPV